MLGSKSLTALALALASCLTQAQAKSVFAHFIVSGCSLWTLSYEEMLTQA